MYALDEKNCLVHFFVFNPPKRDVFIRRGCLAGQISRIEGIPSILEICSIRKSHWS